jgi:glyoxylase-like metal-dependent hydrolase (beta-lactamase superfamily II)
MDLGAISLHPLSDGMYWQDGGSVFGLVPKTLWEQVAEPDEQNRLGSEMQCLLIMAPGQCILVDTGSGNKPGSQQSGRTTLAGGGRLLGSLAEIGVDPADIDLVINTHLHAHHCGGNTRYDEQGRLVPSFPRASYCAQRLELADATFPNERTRATYLCENIVPVEQAGQLKVLVGDTRLSNHVRVVVTAGHTRSHQSVVVESEGKTALFLGDAASWPIHMERLSWVPAYDTEPLSSIETKRNLARWAIERQALLVFGHQSRAGYLHPTQRPDRFRLEEVNLGAGN